MVTPMKAYAFPTVLFAILIGLAIGLRSDVHRKPNSFCALVRADFVRAGRPWGNQDDFLWERYPTAMERARTCLDMINE
jgi:hypothetical protein